MLSFSLLFSTLLYNTLSLNNHVRESYNWNNIKIQEKNQANGSLYLISENSFNHVIELYSNNSIISFSFTLPSIPIPLPS